MQIPKLSKASIIFIVAIVLLEAANAGVIFYLLQLRKNEAQTAKTAEELPPITPDQEAILKAAAPGETGELAQKEGQTKEEALAEANPAALENPIVPPGVLLPAVVFNTQGTISSLQEDGITIDGNGSNFEDQLPRQIKVKFDEKTVVSEKDGTIKYAGLVGLKHLAAGGQILLDSAQNIRGKTEFTARYINKQ